MRGFRSAVVHFMFGTYLWRLRDVENDHFRGLLLAERAVTWGYFEIHKLHPSFPRLGLRTLP